MPSEIAEHIDELRHEVNALTMEVRTYAAGQRELCGACQRRLANLENTTFGNASPGLRLLLDRTRGQVRWLWVGAVAIVGLLFSMFMESLFGKP